MAVAEADEFISYSQATEADGCAGPAPYDVDLLPGQTFCAVITRADRLILAAYGDGTIRWHRESDGCELLALFIHVSLNSAAEKRLILFTPRGYYDCSKGADHLVDGHINRGPDEAADFYPAPTFASTFKRPDIISAALDGV